MKKYESFRPAEKEQPASSPIKTFGTLGVGFVLCWLAFYADVFTKIHGGACKALPIIGVPVDWLKCPLADNEIFVEIDKGVKRVDDTAKRIDDRTVVIDSNVDAMRRLNDPVSVAKTKITNAGYSLDNAGYIKAVTHGSSVIDLYNDIGVQGDEVSLRKAILSYQYETPEFARLMSFVGKAPSESYAAKLRFELQSLLDDIQVTKSTNAIRKMACSAKSDTFIENFVKLNLASACNKESPWVARIVAFGKTVSVGLGKESSYVFWAFYAGSALTFKPEPTESSTQLVPSTRILELAQNKSAMTGTNIQSDVKFSIYDARSVIVFYVFDPASGLPTQTTVSDGTSLRNSPCIASMPPQFSMVPAKPSKPRCSGRLTVYADPNSGLQFVSLQNVKVLTTDNEAKRSQEFQNMLR